MKISTLNQDNIKSFGILKGSQILIEANSTAFYAMISGLAEDKISYPIREIGSNAWDAAGGDVDVTLPTEINPVFSIRDFGPGLSKDFMVERFTMMYHSDKRDDPTKIGGWGLGRFSPFAYLLSEERTGFYLITSWHGGIKTGYVMNLSEDGQPVLNEMFSEPTDERSGLEVSFSVLTKDIQSFREKARDIFWSFTPRPRITPEIEFNDTPPVVEGSNWKIYPSGSFIQKPSVRIGCVTYPINMEVEGIRHPPHRIVTNTTPILFEADISSVQPTLSREDLEYNRKTKETVSVLLDSYFTEMHSSIQRGVDEASSLFDADRILRSATSHLGAASNLSVRELVSWKERAIPLALNPNHERRIMRIDRGWSLETVKQFDGDHPVTLSSMAGKKIVFEHSGSNSLKRMEAASLVGDALVWVRCKLSDREKVLNELGNPENVINLSEYKAEESPSRPKSIRRRSVMQFRNYGAVDRETLDVDLAQPHFYLVVNRDNRWNHAFSDSKGILKCSLAQINSAFYEAIRRNLVPNGVMVMPISSEKPIVPENWRLFTQYLAEVLVPHLSQNNEISWETVSIHNLPSEISCLRNVSSAPFRKIGGELSEKYKKYYEISINLTSNSRYTGRSNDNSSLYYILKGIDALPVQDRGYNPVEDLKKDVEILVKKYPLLRSISSSRYGGSVHDLSKDFKEYEKLLIESKRLHHLTSPEEKKSGEVEIENHSSEDERK